MERLPENIEIIDIAREPWDDRWTELREVLKNQDINLNFQLYKAIDMVQFESQAKDLLSPDSEKTKLPDVLLIDPIFAEHALDLSHVTVRESDQIGAATLFLKAENILWPRAIFDEAIFSVLAEHFKSLDIFSPALITGIGVRAKYTVSALSKLGFIRIHVTDENEEAGRKFVTELKKKYFNVEIKFIPLEQITTLPGVFSILVNVTDLGLENKILDELYFFNFLKSNGCVVDMTLVPLQTPLLKQAQDWGARLLPGAKIFARYDALVISEAIKKEINLTNYTQKLEARVSQVPFDPEPFLKRFLDRF